MLEVTTTDDKHRKIKSSYSNMLLTRRNLLTPRNQRHTAQHLRSLWAGEGFAVSTLLFERRVGLLERVGVVGRAAAAARVELLLTRRVRAQVRLNHLGSLQTSIAKRIFTWNCACVSTIKAPTYNVHHNITQCGHAWSHPRSHPHTNLLVLAVILWRLVLLPVLPDSFAGVALTKLFHLSLVVARLAGGATEWGARFGQLPTMQQHSLLYFKAMSEYVWSYGTWHCERTCLF